MVCRLDDGGSVYASRRDMKHYDSNLRGVHAVYYLRHSHIKEYGAWCACRKYDGEIKFFGEAFMCPSSPRVVLMGLIGVLNDLKEGETAYICVSDIYPPMALDCKSDDRSNKDLLDMCHEIIRNKKCHVYVAYYKAVFENEKFIECKKRCNDMISNKYGYEPREQTCRKYRNDKFDYEAWTDGGCNNMSPYGEGGSAYVVMKGFDEFKVGRKGFTKTTNNRMEMLAIISAVNCIPEGSTIKVNSDSIYSIKSFLKDAHKEGCCNEDLIKLFDRVRQGKTVLFSWVKGHNGNFYNEECDRMCQEEIRKIREKYNIPLYSRYNSPKVKRGGS